MEEKGHKINLASLASRITGEVKKHRDDRGGVSGKGTEGINSVSASHTACELTGLIISDLMSRTRRCDIVDTRTVCSTENTSFLNICAVVTEKVHMYIHKEDLTNFWN